MSRSTFRVLFYLKRNVPKKIGLVPVMCRIAVNGKISQFSCKLDVEEKLWSQVHLESIPMPLNPHANFQILLNHP